jgi:hypothetical protein
MAMWPSSTQRCMARRARSISVRARSGLGEHAEVGAELSGLPVELSGERLAEQGALVGQRVDVALDVAELIVGEAIEPGGQLGFELDRAPFCRGLAVASLPAAGGQLGGCFRKSGASPRFAVCTGPVRRRKAERLRSAEPGHGLLCDELVESARRYADVPSDADEADAPLDHTPLDEAQGYVQGVRQTSS